ncbi:MATE family efflux transporter [Oceanispirochaeta crateris]|uniref:Multidrug-efflux transporter n=1 Tax=Oceanispirochaeta crateris TaxID=2518645 RepID=A0A5C1QIT1_9SPIO|nr:MATE family efflux transporter [Oceanispirochaeta crateris]QEN07069.1 MATE family efflux transporter [Oceanispirochaeta crateris]
MKSALKKTLLLGVPLLFGQLTHFVHQIADSVMLGHFGENSLELAAIGIAGLFTWILNTCLWPLSSGVQAIASRRYGKQDHNSEASRHFTGEVLDNGIIISLYASALALMLSFSAPLILNYLIESDEIIELSLQYIRIMRLALIPTGLFFILQGFFGAVNRTRYIMISGLISNLLNLLLNWIFIFGLLGLPAMGIRGAALGTVLSNFVSFLYLTGIILFKGYKEEYRLLHFDHFLLQMQKDIVNVALPPGIQNILALSIFMVYQTIIEKYSTVFLAATHSTFAFFRLNKTIIGGFARSSAILVGNALGRKDHEDAQILMKVNGLIAFFVALIVAGCTFFFRDFIASIFTSSPETISAISQALLFFLPFFFVEALGYCFEMVFINNGYGRWVLYSESFTNVIFILGTTLLARHFFPLDIRYAWFSFGLYQITHAALIIIGYYRKKWLTIEIDRTAS